MSTVLLRMLMMLIRLIERTISFPGRLLEYAGVGHGGAGIRVTQQILYVRISVPACGRCAANSAQCMDQKRLVNLRGGARPLDGILAVLFT